MNKKTEIVKSKTKHVDAKNVKVVPMSERKSLKRKAEHPPTSEMVMDSIKALRKRNGATFEDIGKYMEENYPIKLKTYKQYIIKFLKKSVDDGVLEKIDGAGVEEKFKIKMSENSQKTEEVVPAPERKSLKRKAEHPPTSEMVMDSIKALRKRTGATFEDIGKYMEEKYPIQMKTYKQHITKFLKKSVDDGVLEKIDGTDEEEKFKIKKSENSQKTEEVVPTPERKSLKRKAEHPPTSEMVMDSIKALRKHTGATFEDIGKYMEEKYPIKINTYKQHINKFLKKSVDDGVLEKTDGSGDKEKFKIKKSENTKKSSKDVLGKDGKDKPMKK